MMLAVLAATAVSSPTAAPHFTLESSGAAVASASGSDARYVMMETAGEGARLTLSLGAMRDPAAVTISMAGNRLPAAGRYPISSSWNGDDATQSFHAAFVAGSPERPVGWFGGESGWVTIMEVLPGQLSGEFEIRARGFLGANPDDEDQWVTVRGTFQAREESRVGPIATVQ
jgi:hypothetical protein